MVMGKYNSKVVKIVMTTLAFLRVLFQCCGCVKAELQEYWFSYDILLYITYYVALCGCDVGFISTYKIIVYHHWNSWPWRDVLSITWCDKSYQWFTDGQSFLCILWFPPPIKLMATT